METNNEDRQPIAGNDQFSDASRESGKAKVTHNLDTGEDEPLKDPEDESLMDFGSGSGGGSAGDGGAS